MLENVRGFAGDRFAGYRAELLAELDRLGYAAQWRVLNASGYAVPQLRPRFVLVALRRRYGDSFRWPEPAGQPPTVGEAIGDLMAGRSWPGARAWARQARGSLRRSSEAPSGTAGPISVQPVQSGNGGYSESTVSVLQMRRQDPRPRSSGTFRG